MELSQVTVHWIRDAHSPLLQHAFVPVLSRSVLTPASIRKRLPSKSTVQPVNIQTKSFQSTGASRDAEQYREQTVCHPVRKNKVLQMQPSGEA